MLIYLLNLLDRHVIAFVPLPKTIVICIVIEGDQLSLRLANRPSLAGYWKFNTYLLEIRDFRERLESLIKRALVGAVTGNRWWFSLKHRIRDPEWATAAIDSMWCLSGALSWSLCPLSWSPASGVLQLSGRLPPPWAAEAASCEGVVTECEVHDALKQVGLNKSPGLDGLPNEVHLRMLHMFVPILTDMFNHWFAQWAILGSVSKSVISLLKKGGRRVWEGLDDYRPITQLNTELKILARVLANRLQLVISDLIGPDNRSRTICTWFARS